MIAACPNCGADVEFRYDDSLVRVCGHCRNAVARSDRGIDSLGKVADLVPLSTELSLLAEGRFDGVGFVLVGMAQIRHPAGGLWLEWYAKLDDGRWGWLAETPGRLLFTFEVAVPALPTFDETVPDARFTISGATLIVAERGTAELAAADGEIPYPFVPGQRYRFADLGDPDGRFATIDYGPLDQPAASPTLYLGRAVSIGELALGGGVGAPAARKLATSRLACAGCGAGIELAAPDAALRVACPYCDALLDFDAGALVLLRRLADPERSRPAIPLGTRGQFDGADYVIVGHMWRAALIDGERYPFEEYLLHSPEHGFRWLVCSDGHWSWVEPLPPGAVETDFVTATCDQVTFRLFQTARLVVSSVVGEFPWKVETGELVDAEDYVAPPAMLSCERTGDEVNWSLGHYLPRAEVERRLGVELDGEPTGIAPNQPFRHTHAAGVLAMLLLAAAAAALASLMIHDDRLEFEDQIQVIRGNDAFTLTRTADGQDVDGSIYFTRSFELRADDNVVIDVTANVDNSWLAVSGDLIREDTGDLHLFERSIEYYSGWEGGESWTEGDHTTQVRMGAVPSGRYVLRLEVDGPLAPNPNPIMLHVRVRQDVVRPLHMAVLFGAIGIPGLLLVFWTWSFDSRRWRNSTQHPANMLEGE